MVDWGAGCYERTADELEPVSRAVVGAAQPHASESVLDLACGTGNAALLVAARGAHVIGVDAAPRLLDVARQRALSLNVEAEFLQGDLLELPIADCSADVVISVFGLIFAPDPARALAEVARVAAPGARVLLSAWIPAGPINDMLAALGRVVVRVTQAPPPQRFPWSDPTAVEAAAGAAGLSLYATTRAELAIRDASPEAYVTHGQEHPMALAVRPLLEQAAVDAEARGAMIAVVREANEDPGGFLVHSPYVVYELRA
jgi:SAM-dependent methyltransferase